MSTPRDRVRRFIIELMDESLAVGEIKRIIDSVRYCDDEPTRTDVSKPYDALAEQLTADLFDEQTPKPIADGEYTPSLDRHGPDDALQGPLGNTGPCDKEIALDAPEVPLCHAAWKEP